MASAPRPMPVAYRNKGAVMPVQASDSILLIVDMQEKLLPAMADGERALARAVRLAQAARLLDVPVVATEQQPEKIGPTVEPLRDSIQRVMPKTYFSATRQPGFDGWLPAARKTVLVAGVEAHVCVLQTIMGLADKGFRVAMVTDACASRSPADHHAALRRARAHGADILTVEMAMFEWLDHCEHPRFRQVLQLVKQNTP